MNNDHFDNLLQPRPHQRDMVQRLVREGRHGSTVPMLVFDRPQIHGGTLRGEAFVVSSRTDMPNNIDRLFHRYLMQQFHVAQRMMCDSLGVSTKLLYQSTFSGYSRYDDAIYPLTSFNESYLPIPTTTTPKLSPLMFLRLLHGPTSPYRYSGKSVSVGARLSRMKPLASLYRWPGSVGLRMEMVKQPEPEWLRDYRIYDYIDSFSTLAYSVPQHEIEKMQVKIRGASGPLHRRGKELTTNFELDIKADYERWAQRA